jgi:hypothetical protein
MLRRLMGRCKEKLNRNVRPLPASNSALLFGDRENDTDGFVRPTLLDLAELDGKR